MQKSEQSGFTLIEVMMAVVIIGILAAIAWPSYTQYVVRNNRVAVQAELMQIAAAAERYRAQQLTYANAKLSTLLYGKDDPNKPPVNSVQYPKTGNPLYTLTLDVAGNGITWVATAAPATGSLQAKVNDGALAIDNTGKRCWLKGAASCDLADSTQDWNAK